MPLQRLASTHEIRSRHVVTSLLEQIAVESFSCHILSPWMVLTFLPLIMQEEINCGFEKTMTNERSCSRYRMRKDNLQ